MKKTFGNIKQGYPENVYYSPRTGQAYYTSSVAEAPASAKKAQARRVMARNELYGPSGIAQQSYRRTFAKEGAKGRNTYWASTKPFTPEEYDRARISAGVKQDKLMSKMYRQRFK